MIGGIGLLTDISQLFSEAMCRSIEESGHVCLTAAPGYDIMTEK